MTKEAIASREVAIEGDLKDESGWEDVDEEFGAALENQVLAEMSSGLESLELGASVCVLREPLTEFHLFPAFPLELRQAIFRQAMPVPCLMGKQPSSLSTLYTSSNLGSR